jgi:hypothetical protein
MTKESVLRYRFFFFAKSEVVISLTSRLVFLSILLFHLNDYLRVLIFFQCLKNPSQNLILFRN